MAPMLNAIYISPEGLLVVPPRLAACPTLCCFAVNKPALLSAATFGCLIATVICTALAARLLHRRDLIRGLRPGSVLCARLWLGSGLAFIAQREPAAGLLSQPCSLQPLSGA